jgi:hypothetical protein
VLVERKRFNTEEVGEPQRATEEEIPRFAHWTLRVVAVWWWWLERWNFLNFSVALSGSRASFVLKVLFTL